MLFHRSVRAQAHAASLLCNKVFKNETDELANGDIFERFEEISPSPSKIFNSILWKMNSKSFGESFVSFMTGYGRCFTFNGLNPHEMFTKE